jgi:hypothetical protein
VSSVIRATFAATLLVMGTQAAYATDPTVSTNSAVPIPDCDSKYPECHDWQQFAALANSSDLSAADVSSFMNGWVTRCARFRERFAHETGQQATQVCTARLQNYRTVQKRWLPSNFK